MTIERRIITGLIVSTDYLQRVAPFWSDDLVPSPEMQRIARWCLDFFDTYQHAPDRDIEGIYMDAIKNEGVPKAEAELIEGILREVSNDYDRGDQFNAAYLFDQTCAFFRERELKAHTDEVNDLRERGQLEEAEALAAEFVPLSWASSRGLDLGTEHGYDAVRATFEKGSSPILDYPGELGDLMNAHLIREGFVAFLRGQVMRYT